MITVKFVTSRFPEDKDDPLHEEHEVELPTRAHALVFAAFCYTGGTPEGMFGLKEDTEFTDSLTPKEWAFVHNGVPTCGMPEGYVA